MASAGAGKSKCAGVWADGDLKFVHGDDYDGLAMSMLDFLQMLQYTLQILE